MMSRDANSTFKTPFPCLAIAFAHLTVTMRFSLADLCLPLLPTTVMYRWIYAVTKLSVNLSSSSARCQQGILQEIVPTSATADAYILFLKSWILSSAAIRCHYLLVTLSKSATILSLGEIVSDDWKCSISLPLAIVPTSRAFFAATFACVSPTLP